MTLPIAWQELTEYFWHSVVKGWLLPYLLIIRFCEMLQSSLFMLIEVRALLISLSGILLFFSQAGYGK